MCLTHHKPDQTIIVIIVVSVNSPTHLRWCINLVSLPVGSRLLATGLYGLSYWYLHNLLLFLWGWIVIALNRCVPLKLSGWVIIIILGCSSVILTLCLDRCIKIGYCIGSSQASLPHWCRVI